MNNIEKLEDYADVMAELMFKLEKACSLKEELFCSIYDLSPMEFRCVKHLSGSCFSSIKKLSVKMNLTPSRLTYLLNGLKKKDLIVRKMDEGDRRIIKVSLNNNGMKFAKEINEKYIQFHLKLLKFIDRKEMGPILQHLQHLLNSITYFLNTNYQPHTKYKAGNKIQEDEK